MNCVRALTCIIQTSAGIRQNRWLGYPQMRFRKDIYMEFTHIITPIQPASPPGNTQKGKRRIKRNGIRTELAFWSFVAPLLLGLAVFVYLPILWSILLSFFNARGTIAPTQFVGFANYASMLNDTDYQQAL